MKGKASLTAILALVAVASVLGTLLAVEALRPRLAQAQAIQGSADYLVGVVGPRRETFSPLFLVDTQRQVVLVYEYDQNSRGFYLRLGRSYRMDRGLKDQSFRKKYSSTKGPSVSAVARILDEDIANVPRTPGGVVALVGERRENRLPFFMIDAQRQSIMVYDYDQLSRELYLRAVRTFKIDREIVDHTFRGRSRTDGPSVNDVQKVVTPKGR